MAEMKRAQLIVKGSVQGVGYRFFALKKAHELGILGWVRNEPDGSVSMEIEGDEITLARYIEQIRHQHPWARVEEINTTWLARHGDFRTFEIKY